MARKNVIRELWEDVTCPICMEIMKEPVIIDCGHNFCLQCITQVGEVSENKFLCPFCKASVNRRFQPNKLLESLMKKIQGTEKEESELRCRKHNEKILYLCEEDREFLCSVCYDSKDHKFHNGSMTEEAVQNYQEQIRAQPQVLGQKDKEVVEEKKEVERTTDSFKAQVHQERLKAQEEFKHLRKNLDEEESFLLARRKNLEEEERFHLARQKNLEENERFILGWLLWLEQEGDKMTEQCNIVNSELLSSFRKLTTSLRAKQQMAHRDLLQDMGATLSRTSTSSSQSLHRSQGFQFTNTTPVPMDREKRINEAIPRHESTIESMNKLTGNLEADEEKDKSKFQHSRKEEDMESCPHLSKKNKAVSTTSGPRLSGKNKAVSTTSEGRKNKVKKKKENSGSWHRLKAENMESWSQLSGEIKALWTTSAPVTLNPASAGPNLILSQDLKTVSLQPLRGGAGNKQAKCRPSDLYHWVLGSQSLSSGRLVWEVKLQGTEKRTCVVGVATELAPGQHCLNQIWALRVSGWECQPITESSTLEKLPIALRKLGVYLDRDRGKVVFFNPAANKHIYTFEESFTGEVFPVFGLLNSGSHITLIP